MWRNPGFAAAALVTIALGIGATTAVFTVVYGVVLRPLPYREPDRLVSVWSTAPRMGLSRALVTAANYRDWIAQNHSFESLALGRHIGNFNLTGAGDPERVQGARVTASLFTTLGVMPALGRAFVDAEETIGKEFVVILSDGLWARRFGRDRSIVGRPVQLNGEAYEVVGIMPPGFAYPSRDFDLWVPLTVNPEEYRTRLGGNFLSVARLMPGVSVEQAQAEMTAISINLAQAHPDSNRDIGALVEPLRADLVRDVRRPLLILLAAVGSLLLIGCASLANLLIARAVSRSGELVLRSALGATRERLVRQAVTELVPLLAVGGAAGLAIAHLLLSLGRPLLPATMPRVEQIAIGMPVLIFTVVLLGLTALVTGVWPALQVARWDVAAALRESLRGGATTLRGGRMRDVLVIVQIAVSVVLIVGASLLARSLFGITRVDPGFDSGGVTSLHLAIPRGKYPRDQTDRGVLPRRPRARPPIPGRPIGGDGQPVAARRWRPGWHPRGRAFGARQQSRRKHRLADRDARLLCDARHPASGRPDVHGCRQSRRADGRRRRRTAREDGVAQRERHRTPVPHPARQFPVGDDRGRRRSHQARQPDVGYAAASLLELPAASAGSHGARRPHGQRSAIHRAVSHREDSRRRS